MEEVSANSAVNHSHPIRPKREGVVDLPCRGMNVGREGGTHWLHYPVYSCSWRVRFKRESGGEGGLIEAGQRGSSEREAAEAARTPPNGIERVTGPGYIPPTRRVRDPNKAPRAAGILGPACLWCVPYDTPTKSGFRLAFGNSSVLGIDTKRQCTLLRLASVPADSRIGSTGVGPRQVWRSPRTAGPVSVLPWGLGWMAYLVVWHGPQRASEHLESAAIPEREGIPTPR